MGQPEALLARDDSPKTKESSAKPSPIAGFADGPKATAQDHLQASRQQLEQAKVNQPGPQVLPANVFAPDPQIKNRFGLTWKKDEKGWQLYDFDNKVIEQVNDRGAIKNVSKDGEGSIVIDYENKTSTKDQKDGSTLEYNTAGKLETIVHPDGSRTEFKWDGDEIIAFKPPQGNWSERLSEQVDNKKIYGNTWIEAAAPQGANIDQPTWTGKFALDNNNGKYTIDIEDKDGRTKIAVGSDQTKETIHATADGKVSRSSIEIHYPYPMGSVRTFYKNNPKDAEEVTSFTTTDPRFKTTYTKVPGQTDLWKDSRNRTFHWQVSLKDKTSTLVDLTHPNNPLKTTRTPEGKTTWEYPAIGYLKEKESWQVSRVKYAGCEVRVRYDTEHQTSHIEDEKRNFHWTQKEDLAWKCEALDPKKPFVPPAETFKGESGYIDINERGDYTMQRADDFTRHRFNVGGTDEVGLGTTTDLIRYIEAGQAPGMLCYLNPDQQARLKTYLKDIEKRDFLVGINADGKPKYLEGEKRQEEIADIIYAMRTFFDPAGAHPFSPVERGKMLEQTAFAVADPADFMQHLNTCNYSDVSLSMLYNKASTFTFSMADIAVSGSLAMGNLDIFLPHQTLVNSLNAQPFPFDPANPNPTGISRIAAIAFANVGSQLNDGIEEWPYEPGSLVYLQTEGNNQPGGRGPSEGVYHYDKETGKMYRTKEYNLDKKDWVHSDSPIANLVSIMTSYQFVSKDLQTGRMIVGKDVYDDMNADYADWPGWPRLKVAFAPVASPEELHKQLLTDPYPKILDVNFKNSAHVVVCTGYKPIYKDAAKTIVDLDKSKVLFDNTWDPNKDHIKDGLPLRLIADAVIKTVPDDAID